MPPCVTNAAARLSNASCGTNWRTRNFSGGATKTKAPPPVERTDRKSTRLNSSHRCISYAVFCLKNKPNELDLEAVRQSQPYPSEPGKLAPQSSSSVVSAVQFLFFVFFFIDRAPPEFPPLPLQDALPI